MRLYRNLSGNSPIIAYDYGEDYIQVKFREGRVYEYTDKSAGVPNVKRMKCLADRGQGLCTYINKFVKNKYLRKLC